MRRFLSPLVAVLTVMACFAPAWGQVLNDSLQGSTIGTRAGGTFCCGGWRVDNQYDSIYWHVGTFSQGAFEYNVTGLFGGTGGCPGSLGKNELSHMYDFTFNNADNQYAPGYQNDPYKHFFRKQCEPGKTDTMEIVWQILPNFLESDTGALSWNSGNIYLFRAEWENVGGNSTLRSYRDGGLIMTQTIPGSWSPAGQSVRVAASTRRADEGASLGAVYSNVKVFDLAGGIPGAPSITAPAAGETVNSQVAYIQFSGGSHTRYQVRVNTQNNPDAGTVSDTGQVDTGRFFTWSGTLSNNTTFYAFARIGSSAGWSGWSAGRQFTVNTAFVPGGIDYVKVKGNTYVNNSGPFLGLGFTHMRSLQRCKFDRTRFTNDVSFMGSKKYNYQRLLTMVSWCGLEIAPVGFTNPCSQFIGAWSDYDQQFKDSIDIAFGFGVKSEVTIFADAQWVMPSDATRMAHIDRVLANIVGREHKIVLIEVGNELFQNGLPDANDVRAKGQYIADRTPIPVALSAPPDGSDSGIVSYYAGSAADITTVHFSRDLGTIEGGWFPVRDSYRTGLGGLPPVSSNEPIGPGSSVNTENDPIKICMAGFFAWDANIISYVFHSKAGVQSWTSCCPPGGTEVFFTSTPGVGDYDDILPFLPSELASWERNDGKAGPSPFTSYSMGQANKWWPEVGGSTNGCSRNISSIKNGRFVTTPIGILSGGLEIEARRPMQFKAYNPLTAAISYNQTLAAGAHFTLAQGTGAYVIIGDFTDVPIDPGGGGGGGGSNTQVSVDLGTSDVVNGLTNIQVGDGDTVPVNIGGRDARRNSNSAEDFYMYFGVSDGYAFNGSKPNNWINVDYYDTGTATLQLQYDATDGNFYKSGPSVTRTNTNTWKTAVWNVTDCYFGNRQNNGADFRIAAPVGNTFHLDKIYVYQKAFSGTAPSTPVTIQAEDFDNGGQGYGYNDTNTANDGGQYRPSEGVDIEATTDAGGGFNVGWINAGEWLAYQINVTTAGSHDIAMRLAAVDANGRYHIEMNGVNITGTKTVPSTGGYQTWTTSTINGLSLNAGVQTMKVVVEVGTGNWNFNHVTVTKAQSPFGGTARAIPGLIQAEDFDDGGAGVAYNDSDVPNNGGAYRAGEQVDIEATTDTGGGFNVGWIQAGEWLEYTTNVNQTGDYSVKLRVASAGSGGTFRIGDGIVSTSAKTFAATGGWQNWTTIIVPGIFASAGTNKILRISMDTADWNLNWIEWVFGGADVVSEDLDVTNIDDGMTSPIGGDGDTVGASIGGHNCRKNMDPGFNDWYYYFTVADNYAFQGNKQAVTVTVDYYDSGTHTLSLQYDGTPGAYTSGPDIVLTNTNTWKTAVLNVGNAYFGNRQNNAADFRIWVGAFTTYLDTVQVFATVGGPTTLNNSAFPSNADGWNIVVWRSGPYVDGSMVWAGTNGNPTGNMLSAGSGGSDNTDSCTREGGEINKAVSTAGYNSLVQVVYDVRMETNQTAGSPCIGGCIAGVLNGDCADKLCVYFSTAGTAGPWTLLEQVLASSLAQNTWFTRTINCPAGANNQANFAVRFRWQFNKSTDKGRLDNVKVIATP